MSETDKTLIVEINGLKIRKNSIYEVTNRVDETAPDGFVREGATKLPSIEIGNTIPCPFVETNPTTHEGVWDTGFYKESPCYRGMREEEVKAQVSSLRENILIPYEMKYGKGKLDHNNQEFWGSFGVNLYSGKYFVSSDEDSLLGLYIAMRGFELAPKDSKLQGSPKFRDAQFCIEDKNTVQSRKSEVAIGIMDAAADFNLLLKTDREKLMNILKYLRLIGVSTKVEDKTIKASFFEWLGQTSQNPEKWRRAYELANNEEKGDIIPIFVLLNKLHERGVITREGNYFVYKGTRLGGDLKNAAENIVTKEDFKKLKVELLEVEV